MDGNDAGCIDNGIGGFPSIRDKQICPYFGDRPSTPAQEPSFDFSSGTGSVNFLVSLLFLEPLFSFIYIKKRNKGSKKFEIKEKFYLKNRLEMIAITR